MAANRKDLTDEMVRDALRACPNSAAAAKLLECDPQTVRRRAAKLGIKFASVVHATSTLYDGDGNQVLQWVKEKNDVSMQLIDAAKEAFTSIKPLPKVKAPKATNADLLAAYPIGDAHFGQYSWAAETGDDYDLTIAESLLCDAVDRLVDSAPPAKTGLLINVGDFYHGDNSTNRTPASQHVLDVDTRWRKVMTVGIRGMSRCIDRMLEKHQTVEVISVPGNHDPHASAILSIGLGLLYSNNPRVRIDESPAKFVYRRHGKTLIGVTHGDTCRLEELGSLMAADRPTDWGETEFRHWFTGHYHQRKFIEGRGFTAEVLRTLAGKDAYAAAHAYRSGRDMQVVVFDKEYGEIERHRADIKRLRQAA